MKYKVGKSKIEGAGKGLFVKKPFREGETIGLAHVDDQPTKIVGSYHNHSENPNAGSIKIGNKRYIVALRNLKPGEEITTDYRQQPELEQPEDFMRKGGMVKMPKDKPEKSKKFSRSLDATNRLFTENKLFEKPKSRKRKVFDPHAKYYADGGEYGMPLGTGVSQNFIGNRDDFNVGGIPNLPLRDNRVNYNAFVNGFEPMTKKQDGGYVNDFIELDLTPDEIQAYKDGGYVVEDISIPSLTKAQRGGSRRKKKQEQQLEYRPPVEINDEMVESVTPFPEAPEDFSKGVANLKEVEKIAEKPQWAKFSDEYEKKNSRQAFINKKKRDYLKNTNKGLGRLAGNSMENFPEEVEKNFANEYDYKKNNYIVRKLGKKKGFIPGVRGEWVDELSEGEKRAVANSKFESKLQPSILSRTLAGFGNIASYIDPDVKNISVPGLTKKEQKEILNSKSGALETFAAFDAPGVLIGNAVNQLGNESYGASYRQTPGVLSGESMAQVTPLRAAVLNPLTYTAAYDLPMLGKTVVSGARNIPKIINTSKESGLLSNTYKINPLALKENPEMYVYRARPVGQNPDMNMAATLRAKEAAGEPLNWMQKNIIKMSEGTVPDMGGVAAREKYYGRWFDKDPKNLDYYINPDTRNFTDNDVIEILRSKLPKAEADKLKVSQFEDAKSLSGFPEREFILPKDLVNSAERFPESSWQQLIQEDEAFNKPHWLKGYKKGGVVSELTDKQIEKLKAQGYTVEYLD